MSPGSRRFRPRSGRRYPAVMEPDRRPEPDPAKLVAQFEEWVHGETLPGRMLANLKTGRLPELLDSMGEPAAALAELWQGWERGTTVPPEVAAGLADGGLVQLLTGVAER